MARAAAGRAQTSLGHMPAPDRSLPTGTVTFMFSDIEGSTRLVHELDTTAYRDLLEQHHALLRAAFASHRGVERGTQGDSFLVIFRDAPSAVAAATEAQRALTAATWPGGVDVRVRMGLHSGEGVAGGDDYVGVDINRAARIASAAHGGQVLLSDSTRALAVRSLPTGVALRDVGQHRLKGLDEPERLHQLVIDGLLDDFPPPRALDPGAGNLPPRVTSFLGRDADLQAVHALLRENRLVTLVGPGGTGKTSLATEVARAASGEFADGAWLVALDAVSDSAEVGSAIVAGLGLRDTSGRSARDRLVDNLSGRSILLVLDNFEQVVDAARLVADLVIAAPALRVLVTSRSPLHVAAEQIYPLGPLGLPSEAGPPEVDALESVPSVRLFVDRAARVVPTFALTPDNAAPIVDICRRLDGLPLGIELAAARISVLGVFGVRDRLAQQLRLPVSPVRDAPARQRTLHDAIAWSHDLLDPAAKALFARLSVFADGCRLGEAEAVCGPSAELGDEVVEVLVRLVDQSLVSTTERGGAVRFGMLETVREFAASKLAPNDREMLLARQARSYLALVEESAAKWGGRVEVAVAGRIAEEWSNLMAAVRWAIEAGEVETALRFVAGLWRFWWLRGDMEAGQSTSAAALAMPGGDTPTIHRMRALEAVGGLFYYMADNDAATGAYEEQLRLARRLGDRKGAADALFNLAFTTDAQQRSPAAARAGIAEIADAYREVGDEVGLARVGWMEAAQLVDEGRIGEGRQAMEATMGRFRELGDWSWELMTAGTLATICLQLGDREAAVRWFLYSLIRNEERQDAGGIVVALPILASVAITLIGPETAATILGAYDGQSRRYAIRMPKSLEVVVQTSDPWTAARSALGESAYAAAVARGTAMSPFEAVDFAIEALRAIPGMPADP
jgi:predicted ATPase/class 3 adenylate cyclase